MKKSMKTQFMYMLTAVPVVLALTAAGCMNPTMEFDDPGKLNIAPKNVPSSIESIELTISGPNMSNIEERIEPGQSSFTLEVPSGEDRIFQMDISNPTSSFTGEKTTSLTGESPAEVTIPMVLSGLKLVVPDRDNSRLVQIDDITGSGWIEKNNSDFSLAANEQLAVTDIAYDQYGRIYTTVYNGVANEARIIRLNSIGELDTSFNMTVVTAGSPIQALAVDRNSERIFFAYEDFDFVQTLASVDYSGQSFTDYDFTTVFGSDYSPIKGLATDDAGWIHIVMDSTSDWPGLVSYHPDDQNSKDYLVMFEAHDVTVRGDYIYIADHSDVRLARVPLDYSSDTTPETVTGDPDSTDTFNGPYRFIPTLTGNLYILDETGAWDDGRLIRFELEPANFPGSKWTIFKAQNIGESSLDYYKGA
jgi:hypothetical protein